MHTRSAMARLGIKAVRILGAIAMAAVVAAITAHITDRVDRRSFEDQLRVARSQADSARSEARSASKQARSASAQVTALNSAVVALQTQNVIQRHRSGFEVAKDARNRLDAMQEQLKRATEKPDAKPCLTHVLDEEWRERRPPDMQYGKRHWDAAAKGYGTVTLNLALNAGKCDPNVVVPIIRIP